VTLYDPGLQPERTELAWRRTALALAVGSLVSMRVLPVMLDSLVWIVPGIVGLVASALLWIAARARYRAVYRAIHPIENPALLPDARLIAVMTLLCICIGGFALAAVLFAAA